MADLTRHDKYFLVSAPIHKFFIPLYKNFVEFTCNKENEIPF
jgi:hypothetical protein